MMLEECLPLLQRTQGQLPAPTSGGSQAPVTPISGTPMNVAYMVVYLVIYFSCFWLLPSICEIIKIDFFCV